MNPYPSLLTIPFLIAYIPCLVVMLKHELIKHSCYKLMFYMGILDCFAIITSCLIPGVFAWVGMVSCPHLTTFQYVVTSIALGIWCSECLTCVVLSFNRCVDLWRHKYLVALFSQHRTYYWIALCFAYLLFVTTFARGLFFSSNAYAWFFDPYYGVAEVHVDKSMYMSRIHYVNNISVIILLTALNTVLIVSMYWKTRKSSSAYLSRMQRRVTIQTVLVCFINFFAAFVYAYMQFLPTPTYVILLGQLTWQLSTGLAPFIYLVLNPTIRESVAELIYPKFIEPISRFVSCNVSALEMEKKTTETTPILKLSR
ncbi:hypothetical protein QR680_015959 [Steinernema hermaphroditum]|uniref:Uncharacterized protein n=1 Tax=Steinernema hermaphroditum TaxID=289476 RepID=A0AA39H9J7_9BILA|nr:hypothetical protein QR680_015959 [Steinernema hermaphroditum]